MEDAVHPDDFRQRFAQAAALQHPQVAATWEVLDVAGRPAALQEWLTGLPSTEWPILAAVPGVWYRLLCQAAVGLHAAHQAGLVHGHLEPAQFLLTGAGLVKLLGVGEPPWLAAAAQTQAEADVAADLAALGLVAATWARPPAWRKGARDKALPESLQTVLTRLTTEAAAERYPTVAALLEDLDAAGTDLPANAEAWDRMLHYVREHVTEPAGLRRSA